MNSETLFSFLISDFGFAKGVVSTEDHYFVVPHTPSGRVQIYDSNWKFLWGWNVEAGAGTFKLQNQAFEDFTQHLRVNGYVHVQRRIFPDGEIVSFKKVMENVREGFVADFEIVVAADVFIALLGAIFVGE